MNTNKNNLLSLSFKQIYNLHPNKRSNLASFIPLLPGFALKVIASHSLKSNSYIFIKEGGYIQRHSCETGSLIMQSIKKQFIKFKQKGRTK